MSVALETLMQDYEVIETRRCQLMQQILELQKKEFQNRNITGLPGATCCWNGKVLKFTIYDKPPILTRTDIAHEELYALWAGRIVQAYREARLNLRFNKVLVLFKITTNDISYWDVDNRAVSLIINGIKATSIIPDDRWQYLSAAVCGAKGPINKTEVLVIDGRHMDDLWRTHNFNSLF